MSGSEVEETNSHSFGDQVFQLNQANGRTTTIVANNYAIKISENNIVILTTNSNSTNPQIILPKISEHQTPTPVSSHSFLSSLSRVMFGVGIGVVGSFVVNAFVAKK